MYDKDNNPITYIGETDFRNQHTRFGIKLQDRFQSTFIIGRSNMGKTFLLQNLALSDIQNGMGLGIIDVVGDMSQYILDRIPQHRYKDVIYFNPSDLELPSAFNPLENVPDVYKHLAVAGLLNTFNRIWESSWGPRMQHIFNYALLTLIACDGTTLLDIHPLLTNHKYRFQLLAQIQEAHILNFWEQEFDKYSPQLRNEAIAPILNKVGVFVSSQPLRNVFGQETSDFNIQELMDGKKIFIANLSKGKIGEESAKILGSVLLTSFMNGAQFRAHQREESRVPFFLYVDEAHNFLNNSMADMLSETRKFKLSLSFATQLMDNFDEKLQASILGNIGTLISFRIGIKDAEILSKEFYPVFNENDLINIPRFGFYIRLCIDGIPSRPFSGRTIIKNPSPTLAGKGLAINNHI